MSLEVVELLTTLKADISAFSSGMDDAGKKSQGLVNTIKQHAVAIGAAMTGLGGTLEHFADPIENSKATLEAVLSNAGSSFDDLKGQIDSTISHMENFGHGAADTQAALATLTTKLGDPTKALNDMGLVAEVAADKHISLNAAAALLGRIQDGNARTLKQFGITVADTAKLTGDATKATDAATKAHEAQQAAIQKLADLKEIDSAKTKLSVSDQIALRDAQQKVTDTTNAFNDAQTKATDATKAAADAQANAKDPLTQLGDKLKGVAEAQANTFGGKMDALKTKVEDFAGSLGAKVGPALVTLGPALSGIGGIISSGVIPKIVEMGTSAVQMGVIYAAQAYAFIAENVAMAASATAAFVAENAATLGIGAAIALLVAGIVWVATHWSESWGVITQAVDDALGFIRDHWQIIVDIIAGPIGIVVTQVIDHFDTIKDAITGVYNWVKDNWPLLLGILTGPIGLAVVEIVKHWDDIKNGFTDVKDWISDRVDDVVDFFVKMPGRITSAVSHAFDGLVSAFKNAAEDMVKAIPGGGIVSDVLGHLPHFAAGGPISGLSVVGEKGPELFMPSVPGMIIPNSVFAGGSGGGSGYGAGGGNTYSINIAVAAGADASEVGRQTVEAIRAYERRSGASWRAA